MVMMIFQIRTFMDFSSLSSNSYFRDVKFEAMKRLINILLIEDDYLDQLEVQRILDKKSIFYQIKIAANGEAGLAMLKEKDSPIYGGPPDIILLDLNMPKMNG